MNGRIYDPLLGRFLSADLGVQFPGDLQSYNRYSYVSNNPLRYTDPTGFALSDEEKKKKFEEYKKDIAKQGYNVSVRQNSNGGVEFVFTKIPTTAASAKVESAAEGAQAVATPHKERSDESAPNTKLDSTVSSQSPASQTVSSPDAKKEPVAEQKSVASDESTTHWYNPRSWNWRKIGSGVEFKGGLGVGLDARLKLSKLEVGAGARVTTLGGWFNLGGDSGGYQKANADLLRIKAGRAQIGLGVEGQAKFGLEDGEPFYRESSSRLALWKLGEASGKSNDVFTVGASAKAVFFEVGVQVNFQKIYEGVVGD